jgi:hypothetical protein
MGHSTSPAKNKKEMNEFVKTLKREFAAALALLRELEPQVFSVSST